MIRYILALALIASSALAQELPAGDRVALQIGQLVIRVENQADQIRSLAQQIAAKDAKIKELEKAAEPKKD